MKQINRKDLHIEDIRTDEYWNRLRIYSILNYEDINSKFRNRYIVNKVLNSKNSVLDIIKTSKAIEDDEIAEDKVLELNNRTYIVENIPIYTFLKISYTYRRCFTQLANWKYINRDTAYFVRIPTEVCKNIDIRKEYENIQLKSIRNYRELYKKKGQNNKDFSINLLPLGVQHRGVISSDLNTNISMTNDLLCSDLLVDNQLGDMFEKILKQSININPNCNQRVVIHKLLEYLKDIVSEKQEFKFDASNQFKFKYVSDIVEDVFTNFEMLINPLGSKDELEFDYDDQVNIGNILKNSNIGNFGASKGSYITGFLSLENIFKLLSNNFQMFVPFFSDFLNIDKELDRKNSECFILSSDEYPEIKKDIQEQYSAIKEWRKKSLEYMSDEISKEYTKYLLPFCHLTRFNLYLDVNDIFNIRNIDFEYKEDWMKLFFQKDPLFKK
jgi:hypothetical protein